VATDEGYGDGLTPEAREIAETFYPHQISWAPWDLAERMAWHDKITQDEVDYLVEKNRLHSFGPFYDRHEVPDPTAPHGVRYTFTRNDRPSPSAEAVNAANRRPGLGRHDGINRMYLIEYRCRAQGIETKCPRCAGDGYVGTPEQVAAHDAWKEIEPPVGEGWQLWKTTSEGSPISPVFASADELVAWMSHPDRGDQWLPAETAAAFVAEGSDPTFIGVGSDLMSGAEFVGFHTDQPQDGEETH
jgi:hypothetical protein